MQLLILSYDAACHVPVHLIHRQWPGPVTEEGKSEPNFIRMSSLKESREQFPCHLIAVFQDHVVAHCVIRALPQKRSVSKLARMIKAGVPLGAVKQAAELAGIDARFLELEKDTKQDNVQHGDEQEELEVTVASLVVTPTFRGRGLGKAMCAFAARMAGNHGNVKRVTFSCSNTFIKFYQKLGCKKMAAVPRPGIPPVRLGNEMFVELDKECLCMADEILNHFSR